MVSRILRKIGLRFISHFLLKAQVLFYCSLNTKFFIFKKEIMVKKHFWQSDLITLSAYTIGILSMLTYTEFDCTALLAVIMVIKRWCLEVNMCYALKTIISPNNLTG